MKATVILFKPNGKYYTDEDWRIPEVIKDHSEARGDFERGPLGSFDMRHSPDFRRIDGGAVLVPEQEPWGYPHLLPSESRTQWAGILHGGPGEGNVVTALAERFECRSTIWLWPDGPGGRITEETGRGWYVWSEALGGFTWERAK